MQYYNTEPQLGSLIPGITIAMEEARAKGEDVSEELIVNTKNALMGPFAGIGDSMLVGTYSPILLSIAMSMCINDADSESSPKSPKGVKKKNMKYKKLWTDMHSNLHHNQISELPMWYI